MGSPWIELRDDGGRLSRRVYLRFGGSGHRDGFHTFSLVDSARTDSGISAFLRRFFQLSEATRRTLTLAMNLIRAGAPGNTTVDSCISDLVKALDTLCKHHGLTRKNLMNELQPAHAKDVDTIVSDAREKLKVLRRQRRDQGEQDQLPVIDGIISKQANVATSENDFGMAVTALLGILELDDAAAMNAYYSTLDTNVTWEDVLSTIRGLVMHQGALRVNSRDELYRWFAFARHLHDICKRIILREIGYKCTYAASNTTFTGQYEIHRVNPSTTIAELGYTTPPCSV